MTCSSQGLQIASLWNLNLATSSQSGKPVLSPDLYRDQIVFVLHLFLDQVKGGEGKGFFDQLYRYVGHLDQLHKYY